MRCSGRPSAPRSQLNRRGIEVSRPFGWLLQEVTGRLSAHLELNDPTFTREVLAAIDGGTTA
ncbi:hypothetical protein BCAR13_300128 [Paraburkholderia caribensis]|nr:hypothetical protein BCAR13_300128 [Paraburkholderia caribensis]